MTTINELKNLVLFRLGFPNDVDFTDTTNPDVIKINKIYEIVKQGALANNTWNFALKMENLANKTEVSDKPYKYRYDMPSDIIDVKKTAYTGVQRYGVVRSYEIKDGYFYTDYSDVWLEYVYDPEEEAYPAYFVDFLSYKISASACEPMTGDRELLQILVQQEQFYLKRALRMDSKNVRTKQVRSQPLINIRGF